MDLDYVLIGQRIKEARKKKGWSQEKLSEEIDVAVGFISRIERGNPVVSLKRLAQISRVLEVNLEYLISGVTVESRNYLNKELYQTLTTCTPDKQRLIYNIAQIVAKTNFLE